MIMQWTVIDQNLTTRDREPNMMIKAMDLTDLKDRELSNRRSMMIVAMNLTDLKDREQNGVILVKQNGRIWEGK